MSQPSSSPEPPPIPPSPQTGVPLLRAKEDQLAQATAMLTARLFDHKTTEEVAAENQVSRSTVQRRLRLARREGVPEEARNILIREALPAALAVVMQALRSTDERIRTASAWKLIDGLEAMKVPEDEAAARKLGANDNDSYEVWRERIKVTRAAVARADIQTAGPSPDAPADPDQPAPLSLREGVIVGPGPETAED